MNNDKNENEYSLYTEKIVEIPKRKYRRVLKAFKYTIATIMLSVIAAIVFFLTFRFLDSKDSGANEPSTKNHISIPDDSETKSEEHTENYPTEATGGSEEKEESTDKIAMSIYNMANKSMVTVTAVLNTSEIFGTIYEESTTGVCIVSSENKHYILTEYRVVKRADSIKVAMKNGRTIPATLISGDDVTNIAIISVEESDVNEQFGGRLTAIQLGNSGFVSANDMLVAVGNICNGPFSMNYGMATNLSDVKYETDSKYGIINTNIACGRNASGVLVNEKGELVGVITENYADDYGTSLVSAYAISGLKSLIEQLVNGGSVTYVGISGNEVTESIGESYDIPVGIYVTEVLANSPAHKAGIQIGDIIVSVGSSPTPTFLSYRTATFKYASGSTMPMTIARRGKDGYKEMKYELVLE